MYEMWKRRAALGAVLVVEGVICVLSTFGATTHELGGRCAREVCSVPDTEWLLITGGVFGVVGAIVIAVAIRGIRRSNPTRK
jgi:uncharacterized protein YjeT (DUF2065 family)